MSWERHIAYSKTMQHFGREPTTLEEDQDFEDYLDCMLGNHVDLQTYFDANGMKRIRCAFCGYPEER
jgi:hypothetical protein